jgi:hypothetical protein
VNVGQEAVNNTQPTMSLGMESRSAVHAAVHDRITNATTAFDSFVKAYTLADARSIY